MTATVYYLRLTPDQIDTVNRVGWDCEVGQRYLAAKYGPSAAVAWAEYPELFEKAASLASSDLEGVRTTLQNVGGLGWAADGRATCHTLFPRSCDVGDIVVLDDGTVHRVQDIGFLKVADRLPENWS